MFAIVNLLTFLRLVGTVYFWYHLSTQASQPMFEAMLWILIGATDFFDGWLARRFDATSEFGANFDAFVDKLASLTLIPLMICRGYPIAAGCFFLFVSGIAACQILLHRHATGKFPRARLGGKIALALWGLSVVPILLGWQLAGTVLILAASVSLTYAVVDYIRAYGWRWR